LDDGVITSLSSDQVGRVLAPKVDAAWYLHELTREMDLSLFVVFSSLSGVLGGLGQGNYAAGNVFMDTLMQQRRQWGLPGMSMAWGAWTQDVGMAGALSDVDMRRMARSGMSPLSVRQGMELFDKALETDQALLGLARLDLSVLRVQREVPAIWQILAGGVGRRTVGEHQQGLDGFAARLAGLSVQERERFLVDLVRSHAAVVLGHASGGQISPDEVFRELGFDSLTSVELRNRLNALTGCALPATVVFDHPTPQSLAAHVLELLLPPMAVADPRDELDRLEEMLVNNASDAELRNRIQARLRELVAKWGTDESEDEEFGLDMDSASDDEIFDLIDRELGVN